MIRLAVMLKAMFQGDSGGPLVACGPDGNCGTTTGMNYDLIGGLLSSSPSSSSSSSLFMSLYHKQECVLDSQIANIKLGTQVLCPLELAAPRQTSQASTQGCRLPDDEDLCLLCTMFNTLKASVITFRNGMSILIILRQGDRGQAMDRRQRPWLGVRILPQSLNHDHLATDSTLEIKTEAFRQRLARRKVS